MSDPSYPNRPDHPDFEVLSKLVREMDNDPDNQADFPAFVASIADPATLTYLANGRALMALDAMGQRPTLEWLAAFGAMYLDGFFLGHEFAQQKAATRLADIIEQVRAERAEDDRVWREGEK